MTAAAAELVPELSSSGHIEFLDRLDRYLRSRSKGAGSCGLIVVHVRNFSRINTGAGYDAGHRLMNEFGTGLQGILRENDWLMPLSGDRVGIVLDGIRNIGHMVLAATRIERIAAEIVTGGHTGTCFEIRIGMALSPEDGDTAELLLRHGEMAVETAAKEKTTFAVFRPESRTEIIADWDLETEMRPGLENSEFHLCYQPKLDARTLRPCGGEALMRWANPRIGAVSPDRFILAAERTGIIDELTTFCLHSAARDAAEWRAQGHALPVAVNLSPIVIEKGNIVATIEHVAAIWGIGMDQFTAEVTENGIISTAGAALRVLHELRDAGVRVSIDDFGTGNSSLAYFKDIPANEVKIDKSFVFAMLDDDASHRLVRSIIDLAHSFNLEVVAEGVENEACAENLRRYGCDVLQGFLYSKPLSQPDFLKYLEQFRTPSA